jgi:PAS domain S-box-containing protein
MKTDNPVNILLVDDRPENLLALEVLLSNENYRCVKANSGREALKMLLRENGFALILMDVQMPMMDGFETAEFIRQSERFKHVPIIFLTANMNSAEYIFKGYQAGAVDYMIKPLSPEILKAKVAVFVDLYKKNQELTIQEEQLKLLNGRLQKQSHYVRSLIEASLDPLITVNSDGKITDMNHALTSITRLPRTKILGTPFFDYFTNPEKAREVYLEVFAEGSIVDAPLTLRDSTGKLIDMLCNGAVYRDEANRIMGVVIIAREKILSKYSRSLIEASLDPLVTISPEGKITDMNEATVNITGLSRELIKGTDFLDYFTHPEQASQVYEEVFSKGFVIDYPLTIRHRQGKLTDVLFNGSVYKDDKGVVLGAVIVARDITAQKRFENELLEAKQTAEQEKKVAETAMKAKQQFLANMSHEIRTPMNAIIGFTKVILKTNLDEKQKEYLNAIKISGDALIVLINDILDLAKVDAGKMSFERIPFKLADSVSTMLQLFETKIQESNLELVNEYDSSIPEFLMGDPVRLHQIILNLVGNAIKFTTEGKIIVSVRKVSQEGDQVRIEFSISDTGIGIAENRLGTIFDNFSQATSGTTRLYGGTGLGLAIVKQLIEAQGGTIEVESEPNKGSTFRFVLDFQETKALPEKETDHGVQLVSDVRTVKILVAEDIVLNQLLMKTLLEEFGFEMDIADNGKIAVEKLQKNHYDAVLMDLQMPEMNGFEATEHIRNQLKSNIPIIALTADVTTVDLEKCREAGMNDYISKPVDEKLLYTKIIRHLKEPDHRLFPPLPEKKENPKAKTSYTDMAYLKELSRNNEEMISEIIDVYLRETPKMIQSMKQAIARKDWESLRITSHSMVPSFATMGINKEYAAVAKKIQDHAIVLRDNPTKDPGEKTLQKEVKEMFSKIESVCKLACEELQSQQLERK